MSRRLRVGCVGAVISAVLWATAAAAQAPAYGVAPAPAAPPPPPPPPPPPAATTPSSPPSGVAPPVQPGGVSPAPADGAAPAPGSAPSAASGAPPSPSGPPPPLTPVPPGSAPPGTDQSSGQTQPSAGGTAAPAPSLEAPHGLHEHDGFYLRVGAGPGVMFSSFASDASADYGGDVKGSFTAGTLGLELAMGGTPAPGLVIGGGLYFAGGTPAKHDITVSGQPTSVPPQTTGMALLGPFVDYYVDPKAGWHVQGALGLASIAIQKRNPDETDPRVAARKQGGFGFMVGGGYDFWVSPQWSFGGLLRVMYGTTETNNSDSDHFRYEAFTLPELLFTVTYH